MYFNNRNLNLWDGIFNVLQVNMKIKQITIKKIHDIFIKKKSIIINSMSNAITVICNTF